MLLPILNYNLTWKLQTSHGNVPYVSVKRWRRSCYQNVILMKDVRALKDSLENLTCILSKNSFIENLRQNLCSKLSPVREIRDTINK